MRFRPTSLLLLAVLASAPAPDLSGLVRGARDLARAGRAEEAAELTEVLAGLGLPQEERAELDGELERSKGRKPEETGSKKLLRIAKGLRKGASRAVASLPDGDGDELRRLCGLVLRIDADCVEARAALGHEKVGGRWLSPEDRQREEQAARFQDALRRARKLPVEIEERKAEPLLASATGLAVTCVAGHSVELHGTHEPRQVERILREALRAAAVTHWLLTGKLEIPSFRGERFLQVKTNEEYLATLRELEKRGLISAEKRRESEKLSGCILQEGGRATFLGIDQTEAKAEAAITEYLVGRVQLVPEKPEWFREHQACLQAGLLNLVCLAHLGTSKVSFTWNEEETERSQETIGGRIRDRTRLVTLFPRAGLAGHRRRMVYLARDGADPAWASTMVDKVGKLEGDALIKATSMAEFLSNSGPILPLFLATVPRAELPAAELFEKALGEPLESVERKWRRWLLREGEISIVQRLAGEREEEEAPPDAARAAAYLSRLRERASQPEVGVDLELCGGARAHALYLNRNPEQLSRWPDAHEEYPDCEGFSVEGAWAGLHSVIAPGSRDVEDAIDGWMGTFYHRLPLTHPGLLLIGWGLEGETAVLDAGSLCMWPDSPETVLWPPDGTRDVPTRFNPELPNPVPGEDQSRWGYPVTLQTWRGPDLAQRIDLALHEGGASGPEVDCWISTPTAPTNPELAPKNAWCLIPKAALRPSTRYTVVARIELPSPCEELVWSFSTRAR